MRGVLTRGVAGPKRGGSVRVGAGVWAAAGHPHAVFNLTPAQLLAMTGAPVVDVRERDPQAGGL